MVNLEMSTKVAFILIFVFLFLSTNFSPPELGTLYAFFVAVYFIAMIVDILPEYPISKTHTPDLMKIAPIMVFSLFLWVFLSGALMNYFGTAVKMESISSLFGGVLDTLASQTTPPVLVENSCIYLFVFGFLIPIAESMIFLGALLPFVNKIFVLRATSNPYVKMIIVSTVVASVVALWHLTSHMYMDQALISDFLFFFISSVIVLYQKDLKAAIGLHIGTNTMVILRQLGWIASVI